MSRLLMAALMMGCLGGLSAAQGDAPDSAKVHTAVCPVSKDTWIYEFRPDSNYGGGLGWKDRTDPTKELTVPKMFLGFGGSDRKVILLEFDLSKLPKGAEARKAVASLYNDYAGSSAGTEVAARMVFSKWEEGKVTWRTAPKILDDTLPPVALRGSIGRGQEGRWYRWEVTDMVRLWLSGQKPNCGLALVPVGDFGVDRDFVCQESADKQAFAPKLELEYVVKPVEKPRTKARTTPQKKK